MTVARPYRPRPRTLCNGWNHPRLGRELRFRRNFDTNQGSGVPSIRRTAVNRESSPGRPQIWAGASQGSGLGGLPRRHPLLRRSMRWTATSGVGARSRGVVEMVGDGVSEINVGDHVVITLIKSCGSCRNCQTGVSVACTGGSTNHPTPLSGADANPIAPGLGTAAFAERRPLISRRS